MKNNNDKIFLTPEALENIKREYEELTTLKRKEVAQKIKAAREEGDITDSAMYDSARREQSFVEGRIEELTQMLKKVAVVDEVYALGGEVGLGCRVKVHIEGSETEFHLVSAPEADPVSKKISIDSPLGQAMLGKKVGDEVSFEAPVGTITYKILSVG
ncbi:MAG: transcription elongation factor GreA [bacterium]